MANEELKARQGVMWGTGAFDEIAELGARLDKAGILAKVGLDPIGVDEIVEAFEKVYTQRSTAAAKAAQVAEGMKAWAWGPLNEKLLQIVCDQKTDVA